MKTTFTVLIVLLCVVSLFLYSYATLNWQFLNTIIPNSVISLSSVKSSVLLQPIVNESIKPISATVANRVLLPPSENRRFAIFACSIHATTAAYTFYTPMTAASWQRVGYEPIVVFVGDFKKPNVLTRKLNITRNYLKHIGAHMVDIQCNESYAVKLSQLVRVFSGFLPDSIVQDEDNILTGDSDLMPLKASEYKPSPGTHGFIFNAFCCGSFQRRGKSYTMYPMGHVFLQKKAWRALVMESQQHNELLSKATDETKKLLYENVSLSSDLISLYGRHEFQNVFDQRMDKGDSAWYMDQVLCSMLIIDYRAKYPNFTLSLRGRADRLDRAFGIRFWDRNNFDGYGDAHLVHDEVLEKQNWIIFTKLLKALFNSTLVSLFNDYYEQFVIPDTTPVKPTKI